ncbi:hypothetical protein [Methylobacterium nodulans]|uniref:Uncharacterized protein n=1 Tax=Methylobacterium nodulans (strain LMG 21967 / CNCM I-2342 / ORS 2060) TaxID=460265 RepID=B8IXN5_METNO|nr:hypothetical protein [Methylobacterium nodulans]ACL62867.1 hypothetical protein Mnod_7838 [Methylobacterium nodulans ORS 2060]
MTGFLRGFVASYLLTAAYLGINLAAQTQTQSATRVVLAAATWPFVFTPAFVHHHMCR